jgi:hypothetical protein
MFSQQTETEINNNISQACYGGLIALTAHAYNEILMAARNWDAQQIGAGSSRGDYIDMGGGAVVWLEQLPDGSLRPIGS